MEDKIGKIIGEERLGEAGCGGKSGGYRAVEEISKG